MYNSFFGFRERPFKLVPNPDYLYLSRSHEEALAHLKYAVTQGEGFVEITGEVGTGKTMLCRAFLENMADDEETAYIFNPKLDALGLLQAINDEFGIPSDFDNTKALIDALNAFLMAQKAEGRQAVLIIDEAQNLGADVLEQLRLLSNLETTREKLLQIILVGQPELGEMLDSYELRQLAQRISLSCRLTPLTFKEMGGYIGHRIHVAARKQSVRFTRPALRRIYRYSRGLPRLVNIACDRALLVAYGKSRHRISGGIAREAVSELSARGYTAADRRKASPAPALMLAALAVTFAAVLFYQLNLLRAPASKNPEQGRHKMAAESSETQKVPTPRPELKTAPSESPLPMEEREAVEFVIPPSIGLSEKIEASPEPMATETETTPAGSHIADSQITLGDLIQALRPASRQTALSHVLLQWGEDTQNVIPDTDIEDDPTYFTWAAKRHGLEVYPVKGSLGLIRELNLPAIMSFTHPAESDQVYLAVVGADSDTMTFYRDKTGERISASVSDVGAFWSGEAYVLWENSRDIEGVVGVDAGSVAVAALQALLRDTGRTGVLVTGAYDAETRMTIKKIQARHGIPVDGYAGPLTKIVLYQLSGIDGMPRLEQDDKGIVN